MCSSLPSAPGLGPRAGRAARDFPGSRVSPAEASPSPSHRPPAKPHDHSTSPGRLRWQANIQPPAPTSVSSPKAAAQQRDAGSPHPCRTYGVARPAQRLDSMALGCRSLIRPPWPWAATRDENRWPGRARLSLVRHSPLLRGRFSFQDEAGGSSPPRPTTSVNATSNGVWARLGTVQLTTPHNCITS